jgi:spore coat protein H
MRSVVLVLAVLTACGNPPGGGDDDAGATDAAVTTTDGAVTPTGGARVFDPTVLHDVSITVAAEYLDTLENDQDVRVPCTITIDGETIANAGIRKKGATSLRPLSGKPGFTVKFNDTVPGQKLDGLKKLTIDNAIQDGSLLTGHLSYEVYRRAGLPAPRTSHATLSFNGTDKGLFVLEESTNSDYLETHFGNGDGNLYEGPWDFPHGVAAADLKDEVSENRTRDDLTALHAVVMNSTDLATELPPLLDVDQFITNYAVEVVAALWDNYAYVAWNYYLYNANGRFVILTHGVNWPYWVAELDPFDLYTYPWGPNMDPPGFLCERVRAVPALDAQFRAEVTRVARDAFDVPLLLARIDQAEAALHARPLTGESAEDLAAFDQALPSARAFVTQRRAYLAELLGF